MWFDAPVQDEAQTSPQDAKPEALPAWGLVLTALQGKKTYSTLLVTAVLLLGQYQHWWVLPEQLYRGLELLALAFIKAGLTRESKAGKSNESLNPTGTPL